MPETYDPKQAVQIFYRNHRGVHAVRRIIPGRIWYGSTEWHPEPGWLLEAFDVERKAERSFAMCDIMTWDAAPMEAR